MEVSQSKLKTWRNCRMAYHYKYVERLTKKFKPMPFMRGEIIHDALEAHYKGKDPWKVFKKSIKIHERAIKLNPEEYGNLPEHIKVLLEGYFEFYKKEKIKVLGVEEEFRAELTKGIYIVGKRDLIAEVDKLNFMVEHKCHNKIPDDPITPYANVQAGIYIWDYNRQHKKKLDGVMWNYIWGKVPATPKILKNGDISQRQTQMTWLMYKEVIKSYGFNPKDYLHIKADLAGNEANFYQRKKIPLNKYIVENIVEDAKITALDIQKNAGKDKTRNLDFNCIKCEFKNLCLAQLKGLDDNFIIKADFKRKEKDE